MAESATNVATFPHPLPHASLKGRPVRLMAIGDVPGKSPAYLYIGEDGRTTWESQANFVITDQNCLPTSQNVPTTR